MSEVVKSPKERILEGIKEAGITIPDQYQEVFNNHVNVLATRLENKECNNMDVSELENQLSKESIELSEKILAPLLKEYGAEGNHTEAILLAIYIDLAQKEVII